MARHFWGKGVWQGLCVPDRWPGHGGLNEHLQVGRLSCYHSNRVVLRKRELRATRCRWLTEKPKILKTSFQFTGSLMASKTFCTKIPDSSEGLLDGIILLFFSSNSYLLPKSPSKSAGLIKGAPWFQIVPLLPLAFGIKSKLSSVVLLELLIVSHLASAITSHTHPCPLQPLASPYSLNTPHSRPVHRLPVFLEYPLSPFTRMNLTSTVSLFFLSLCPYLLFIWLPFPWRKVLIFMLL